MNEQSPLLEWLDDVAFYRGLKVERKTVHIAGRAFQVAALKDAADLLDDDHFARQFLDEDRAPYGMELWPSASMLAERVLLGDDGGGRAAIEIGCGLALVSMAAATMGWRMLATDNEPESLRFAAYNASLNEISLEGYETLDWTAPPTGRRFDRVFGADLLYDHANHVPILTCIKALLAADGMAVLADPNRSVADDFEALARDHGFAMTTIPSSMTCSQRGTVNGRIFELRL